MGTDIFISYSREDQALAQRFADAFAAEGFSVWWDTELRPGESFDSVIEQALRAAKAVVVLWSPRSVASRWVRAEATLADRLKTLVPVIVEPCDLPIIFELTHAAELSRWNGALDAAAWKSFLAGLRQHIAGTSPATSARSAPAPAQPAASQLATQGGGGRPTLVVRAFADLTSAKDQGEFVGGLMEEIAVALSRSSRFSLVGPDASPRYILDGSVRGGGSKIRVSVKLMAPDAADSLWSERYDGAADDPFSLQEGVASAVAATLEGRILTAEVTRLEALPANALNTDELILLATRYALVWDQGSFGRALGLLEQALELAPRHPVASALAAWCHAAHYQAGWTSDPAETRRLGQALGAQAIQGAPLNPVVIWAYAAAELNWGEDLTAVDAMLDRAVARAPDLAMLLNVSAWIKGFSGSRAAHGLAMFDRAAAMDSENEGVLFAILGRAICLLLLRQFDEAVRGFKEVAAGRPDDPQGQSLLVAALAHGGHLDEARAALAKIRPGAPLKTILAMFRDPDERAFLREGLRLAGADV